MGKAPSPLSSEGEGSVASRGTEGRLVWVEDVQDLNRSAVL